MLAARLSQLGAGRPVSCSQRYDVNCKWVSKNILPIGSRFNSYVVAVHGQDVIRCPLETLHSFCYNVFVFLLRAI